MHLLGGCYIPGLFITMKDKSKESYDVVFDLLISAIQKLNPTWDPSLWKGMYWMTDFEESMRSSIKERFPVILLGCYFHFRWLYTLIYYLIACISLSNVCILSTIVVESFPHEDISSPNKIRIHVSIHSPETIIDLEKLNKENSCDMPLASKKRGRPRRIHNKF